MTAFTTFVEQFSDIVWNSFLLFLLVGTGIFFTIRLRGVQVRRFGEGFRRVFGGFTLRGKKADAEGMSSFQALTTAIAAQVGTGNITGCATALVSGGPGALFWTWMSAFFGMATIYAEAVLAQHYKTTVNGHVTGGPAYYIRAAFKGKLGKILATVFSVLIILALGFMGNMVQSNSIGDAFHNAFGVNRLVVGVVVAAIAAFIFLGGVQRIAAVTEKIVPVMAAFYIVGCIVILVMNARVLPNALKQVFVLAFQPQAMAGGLAGVSRCDRAAGHAFWCGPRPVLQRGGPWLDAACPRAGKGQAAAGSGCSGNSGCVCRHVRCADADRPGAHHVGADP